MHRAAAVAAAALCCLAGRSLPAQAAPAAATLAHQVDLHYNHLQSLRAHFVERYQFAGTDRSESGTLLLRKPGRMRWTYDVPAGKLFLLDGKFATLYSPGDAQAQRQPEKSLDDLRSPLRFLLGHTELAKELDGLTLTPISPGIWSLSGVPKGMAQRIRSLALTVSATAQIQSMRLEETDGAITTFTFTDITENIPTRDADFTLTPLPGVAIVSTPSAAAH